MNLSAASPVSRFLSGAAAACAAPAPVFLVSHSFCPEPPGEIAFWSCDRLLSVRLPKALQRIGDGAFSCCHSLLEIDLPDRVQSVGEKAFSSCDSLYRVHLPGSFAERYCRENGLAFRLAD